MINKNFFFILILIMSPLLTEGCLYKQANYSLNSSTVPGIQMSGFDVIFYDNRENVDERQLNLTFFTVGGQEDYVSPKINQEIKPLLKDVIENFNKPGSDFLIFEVNLVEGYYGFTADGWTETEITSCKINLRVKQKDSSVIIGSTVAEDHKKRTVSDTSIKKLEQLFYVTIQQAMVNAIEQLELM